LAGRESEPPPQHGGRPQPKIPGKIIKLLAGSMLLAVFGKRLSF
jgi:hypothetical protein